ncbi:MAG: hypothetical protein HOD92_21230 [Deltaproteobacteria bacterium]|jgi:hypothetical protein|nr:hypothetical protein [Deltaproteobacteria bacterium]MBT4525656.1 hypothetical protein [Deltaproteobacteria bacterium]
MNKELLSNKIRNLADSIGIDSIGFAEATTFSDSRINNPKQKDPSLSLPDAKSIQVFLTGYFTGMS